MRISPSVEMAFKILGMNQTKDDLMGLAEKYDSKEKVPPAV